MDKTSNPFASLMRKQTKLSNVFSGSKKDNALVDNSLYGQIYDKDMDKALNPFASLIRKQTKLTYLVEWHVIHS